MSRRSPNNLVEMFESRARQSADRIAATEPAPTGWRELTWGEWHRRSATLAYGLRALGIAPGDAIALMLPLSLDWLVIEMAVWMVGGVSVPIYTDDKSGQVTQMLRRSRARVLFVNDRKHWEMVERVRPELDPLEHLVLYADPIPSAADTSSEGLLSLAELSRLGQERRTLPAIAPDDTAALCYTPGTEGDRKGVLLSHRNLMAQLEALTRALPLTSRDTLLLLLPAAHVLAKVLYLMGTFCGFRCALDREPLTMSEELAQVRPTVVASHALQVHKLYLEIVANATARRGLKNRFFGWAQGIGRQVSRLRFSGLRPRGLLALSYSVANRLVFRDIHGKMGGRVRFILSKGQPLTPRVLEFFYWIGLPVLEGYGLTETSALTHINRPDNLKLGSVGLPLPGVEAQIEADGEIAVKGPVLMKGYSDGSTPASIGKQGFLHTGDLGEIDDEGFLRVIDRKSDLIVSQNGDQIAPVTIENLLRTSSYIDNALVYGPGDEFLCALIGLSPTALESFAEKEGISVDNHAQLTQHPRVFELVDEIVAELNTQLAPYESIRKFAILDENFSRDRDELTPMDGLKRRVVIEKYKHLFRGFYEELNR